VAASALTARPSISEELRRQDEQAGVRVDVASLTAFDGGGVRGENHGAVRRVDRYSARGGNRQWSLRQRLLAHTINLCSLDSEGAGIGKRHLCR
jgi:hypothetical protein